MNVKEQTLFEIQQALRSMGSQGRGKLIQALLNVTENGELADAIIQAMRNQNVVMREDTAEGIELARTFAKHYLPEYEK